MSLYRIRIRLALWLRAIADRVEGPYQHFTSLTTAKECDDWMMENEGRHCANPKEHYR